jgi:hypothetical protein
MMHPHNLSKICNDIIVYRNKYILKNFFFWDVTRVALVRTQVPEDSIFSAFRVKIIGELGKTLVETSKC